MSKNICPYCMWGELEDRFNGYWCPICQLTIPIEVLIIYDEEKDDREKPDKSGKTD